ncbi:Ig-like domain-containing protein [Sanguibacter sp. HDW7]|uniref:Ig-like domain-containing protein n=1 Tax=Sanguibacter sp. HDW7 TaxID=2714931 RepID=UPI00140B5AB3|nr:Ig-like domain-containing protein [Sanguibacter sp. HDW7]QIK82558.1 Ig-like domain repeat protein [Sanguibacter sp. HDW7]
MRLHHRTIALLGALALALPAVLVASPAHAAELVESEPNDNTSVADALPLATTIRGSSWSDRWTYDRDYFETTIPKDSRLTLQMVFPSGLVGGAYEVTLYDGSGGRRGSWELEGTDSAGAWGRAQAIFVPAGKVRVLVEAQSTDAVWGKEYTLRLDATPGFVETEGNDNSSVADALPLATVIRGSTYGTQWYDRDYYVTNIPKDSRVTPTLTFPSGLVGGAYDVTLYDSSGRARGSWALEGSDSAGAWRSAQAIFVPAGPVTMLVEAQNTDAVWGKEYALRLDATPGFVETESNDNSSVADVLPLGTTVLGSVYGTSWYDRDYTVTRLASATRVRVGLTFPTGLAGAAYTVSVYDDSQRLVWSKALTGADASGAWASRAIVPATSGNLYVLVEAKDSDAVWGKEYRLRLDPVVTAARPRVSGAAKVGKRLTAVPGTWTSGARLTYQWFRSGKAITGATARTYVVRPSDAGRPLTVRVAGSRSGYLPASSTSAKVTVARLTPKVTASKVTVKSGATARLSVSVATSATSRPTGTVTVKVAGKTVRVTVSAKAKGKVRVTLPKISKRGTHKVTVTFSPSGSTKVSTTARTVTTTVRVR